MNNCYVNVCGGLGNQLFQIANGFSYSKKHHKDLFINPTDWTAHQGHSPLEYQTTIFRNFPYWRTYTRESVGIHEKTTEYYELDFKIGNVSLNGYFQSLKYFEEYKDEFISKLWFPKVDHSIIKDGNVAFHIRRGDYLNFPDTHYVCNTTYFKNMFKKFENYHINVFTDSPTHVLKEFEEFNFNLIQTSSELNDLTLMSHHNNIVCSNSSFSWWASILGPPKNMIIVPSKWFNDRDCEDIYFPKMIKYDI